MFWYINPHNINQLAAYSYRSLTMDIVKIFLLKNADSEPVMINNIAFTEALMEVTKTQVGTETVDSLEALVRTLQVLQEIDWTHKRPPEEQIGWKGDRYETQTEGSAK